MSTRITVPLESEESKALIELAYAERRHPRQQAALLIRRELERRGLLPQGQREAVPAEMGAQHARR